MISGDDRTAREQIFDDWPERYDRWFETPLGQMIKHYETRLVLDFLKPKRGELILDAGCGTGIFTREVLKQGARVVGLDVSWNMLRRCRQQSPDSSLFCLQADMLRLPFRDNQFNKTLSVTALEFIADGAAAVGELFRVTKPGGLIVVATLNRLSPWADRRTRRVKTKGHPIFARAVFRSPAELLACAPVLGTTKTAIHFSKEENPLKVALIEEEGNMLRPERGAFVIASWVKK